MKIIFLENRNHSCDIQVTFKNHPFEIDITFLLKQQETNSAWVHIRADSFLINWRTAQGQQKVNEHRAALATKDDTKGSWLKPAISGVFMLSKRQACFIRIFFNLKVRSGGLFATLPLHSPPGGSPGVGDALSRCAGVIAGSYSISQLNATRAFSRPAAGRQFLGGLLSVGVI